MQYLTTGQIAKMLGLNPRTIIRYINKGVLKGHKLPGRGNNRVSYDDFVEFCHNYDMPVPEEVAVALAKPKILIVEDDKSAAKSLQRIFKSADYDTIIAHDSFQAGAYLHQHQPQVMTLDLHMPGVDGLDILRFTREQPEFAHMKIIVISGSATDNMRVALLDGADAVIQKPFRNETLLDTIAELLDD